MRIHSVEIFLPFTLSRFFFLVPMGVSNKVCPAPQWYQRLNSGPQAYCQAPCLGVVTQAQMQCSFLSHRRYAPTPESFQSASGIPPWSLAPLLQEPSLPLTSSLVFTNLTYHSRCHPRAALGRDFLYSQTTVNDCFLELCHLCSWPLWLNCLVWFGFSAASPLNYQALITSPRNSKAEGMILFFLGCQVPSIITGTKSGRIDWTDYRKQQFICMPP